MSPGSERDDGVWTRLRGALRASFSRLGARLDEMDDLVQESLARIFETPHTFDGPGPMTSFARKVGRNLWIDEIRRRATRGDVLPVAPDDDPGFPADLAALPPEAIAQMRDDARQLAEVIRALPARHRVVLEAVLFEGLGYEALAERLGIPRGTVKSRMHYAVRTIRQKLGIELPVLDAHAEDGA